MIYYQQHKDWENRGLAATMRRSMNEAECHLWFDFMRPYPLRFGRKKCIFGFIADFYCAKAKLLIVIDGNPNNPTTPIDDTAEGKKKLWRYGYEILHLTRDDIMHHFEDVCLEIEERIEEATGVLS